MKRLIGLILLASIAIAFTLDLMSYLVVEGWWFDRLGYDAIYQTQVFTRAALFLLGSGITGAALGFNLWLVERWQPRDSVQMKRLQLKLIPFLGVLIGTSLLLLGILLRQWDAATQLWESPGETVLGLQRLADPWVAFRGQQGSLAWVFLGGSVLLILGGRWLNRAIALGMSLSMGFILSAQWTTVLAAIQGTAFSESDPVFNQNVGFYVFVVPVLELIRFWWVQGALVAILVTVLAYLEAGNSFSEGYFAGFTLSQSRHLYGLLASVLGAIALSFWLDRYALLYSTQGAIVGAGFTAVHVSLPARTCLSAGAVVLALIFLKRALPPLKFRFLSTIKLPSLKSGRQKFRKELPARGLLVGYGGAIVLGIVVLPGLVQLLIVQPNELTRERPYIVQSIQRTRQAFDLNSIDEKPFSPQDQLTPALVQANLPTIRNIRLWDTRPLLDANRQLQRIRPYYEFPDADVDRYTLRVAPQSSRLSVLSPASPAPVASPASLTRPAQESQSPRSSDPVTETRQVLIAARELDYQNVADQAQTWINQRLIYTHGYGFTLSPVNTAASSGLPEYFVRDIGTQSDDSSLQTSSPEIRASLPIERPRIYFGEMTRNYVMTHTKVPELDYPRGSENAYNTYDGLGGIDIDTVWKRVLTAIYLRDWQMLLTENFTPQTQVLFRREIRSRVRAIAPFLRYDRDPYLVAANAAPSDFAAKTSNLYWIIDAYTISDRYPYSDPGNQPFNYIRNPVKVVVDAYNGSVTFYTLDPNEPILSTWSKIFKGTFQPIEAMPDSLRSHIRYPLDLFEAQSQSLLNYHMTDPQVFYNREDPWRVPNEIYGDKEQPVQPYYLIMKLPEGEQEEFVLLYPFTPARRNNMIAWLAARSDGANYGKRLLYRFPKQTLVFGPEQIEALINQNPTISQQISLWNRQGSRVLQGNLLIIPIEQSLLYVEPIYLEADANRVPTLARVIVVYQERVVMEKTLDQALASILSSGPQSPSTRPAKPPAPRPA